MQKKNISRRFNTQALFFAASVLAVNSHAQAPSLNPSSATLIASPADVTLPARTMERSLLNLGIEHGLTLRGTESEGRVEFGVRQDEVVESATLNLEYTLSPALLPQLSHLKLILNDQMVQTIALPQSQLGKPQSVQIPLDPRYFADYNRLDIRFVGHYTMECENPSHSSLWAQVSNESRLQLQLRQVKLPNNLAQLPLPFFDPRDTSKVKSHFVFSANPSTGTLKAAGAVAGWLGAKADFRGSHIQALHNQLPQSHAVVFANAQEFPDFLADTVKEVKAPTLQLIEHPQHPAYQLLLVMGKDATQMEVAAQALALGKTVLTGNVTTVQSLELPEPRQAYDAPRWHNTQRPIEFADLVGAPSELQVKGYSLNTEITTYLRVPPDLFTWNHKNLPVQLHYRYTPNASSSHGRVAFLLNHNLVHSSALESTQEGKRGFLPKLGYDNDQKSQKFYVPAEWLLANNRLDFEVQLPGQEQGNCLSQIPVEVRAALDPKSSIDLSGLPHYIAMPDLQAYTQGGFPFSRLADLRETTVVMPTQASPASVGAYLNAIAHISAITGYPGTRFQLLSENEAEKIGDSDVLLISDGQDSPLLDKWRQQLPALVAASSQSVTLSQRALDKLSDLWHIRRAAIPSTGNASFQGNGPLAAVAGFESPQHSKRSVVALMANSPQALSLIENNINNNAMSGRFMGDLTLLNGQDIQSFRVQPTYFVGQLSLIQRLWFKLHEYPITLALIGCLIGLVFTFFVYASLRFLARRRLERAE